MPALQVADHSIALLQRVLQRGPPPDELQPMRPGLLLLALALVGAAVGQAVQELQPGPAGGRTAQEPPGGRREPQRQGAVQASGALEKPSVPPQPAVSATPPAPDGLAAEPAEPTDPGMGRESVFGPAAAPPQVWLCSLLTGMEGARNCLRTRVQAVQCTSRPLVPPAYAARLYLANHLGRDAPTRPPACLPCSATWQRSAAAALDSPLPPPGRAPRTFPPPGAPQPSKW